MRGCVVRVITINTSSLPIVPIQSREAAQATQELERSCYVMARTDADNFIT